VKSSALGIFEAGVRLDIFQDVPPGSPLFSYSDFTRSGVIDSSIKRPLSREKESPFAKGRTMISPSLVIDFEIKFSNMDYKKYQPYGNGSLCFKLTRKSPPAKTGKETFNYWNRFSFFMLLWKMVKYH